MTRIRLIRSLIAGLLGVRLLTGSVAAAPPSYSDPFQYCTAVGTIDSPDQRYTGPKVPEAIARGLQRAFGAPPGGPLTPYRRNSYWRCMNGKVYACNVGANLPCMAKARIDRSPTPPMREFCRANPGAEAIPAYVTGRETVYLWGCRGGAPYVVRQVNEPDERGFLARFWYPIQPEAAS